MSRKSETPAERDARLTREDREDMERRSEQHRWRHMSAEDLESEMYEAARSDDRILMRVIGLLHEQHDMIVVLNEIHDLISRCNHLENGTQP